MLGFNRIKGFLRRIGIRDNNAAGTPSAAGAGAAPTASKPGGASSESCSILAGLPPNAGSQAILRHVERFVVAHSLGDAAETGSDAEVDEGAAATGAASEEAVGSRSPTAALGGAGPTNTAETVGSVDGAFPSGSEQDGREMSSASTNTTFMAATGTMDPFMLHALTAFPEATSTPTAASTSGAHRFGNIPPPLLNTTSARRRSTRPDLCSEGHYYNRFRAQHPEVSLPWLSSTAPSPSGAAAATAPVTGGMSLLTLLLKERADVMDALDICIQEVPSSPAQDAATTAAQAVPVPDKVEPASSSASHLVSGSGAEAATDSLARQGSVAAGDDGTTTATTGGEKVFGIVDWRRLLLRIVELLIDVDQAIYIEQHVCATATSATSSTAASPHAAAAAARGSTVDASATSARGSPMKDRTAAVETSSPKAAATSVSATDTSSEQQVEAMLTTECAIATWVVLRDVLQQQIAILVLDERKKSSRRPSVSASKSSGTETAATAAAGATSADGNVTGDKGGVEYDEESLRQLLGYRHPSSGLVVDWHRVVRELQEVMCVDEASVAECVLCASFLHDDNRELMMTIIQHPLPRALYDRVSTHKRRESTKPVNSTAAAAPATTPATSAPAAAEGTAATTPPVAPTAGSTGTGSGAAPAPATTTAASTSPATRSAVADAQTEVDLTIDDVVQAAIHVYNSAILHSWRAYLEEKALISGVVKLHGSSTTQSPTSWPVHSAAHSSAPSTYSSRRDSVTSTARQSLALPVASAAPAGRSGCESATARADARVADEDADSAASPHAEDTALPAASPRSRSDISATGAAGQTRSTTPRGASPSLDRSPQQPVLTARPSQVGRAPQPPLTAAGDGGSGRRQAHTSTPDDRATTPLRPTHETGKAPGTATATPDAGFSATRRSPVASGEKRARGGGGSVDPTSARQLVEPLDHDDPFIFCRVATAFSFSAEDLSEADRETVLSFLRDGIGARLAARLADTRPRPRRATVSAASKPTASSRVVSPGGDPLAWPLSIDVGSPSSAAETLHEWVSAEVERATQRQRPTTLPQWVSAAPYTRVHTLVLERVLLIAWAAALHKEVELCLRARPPHLDAAVEAAREENVVASVCQHFRSRQLALSSVVRAKLAVGKTHEALAAARKHFKREKRAWTSNAQTVFTAIGYLESMVQLVQAQSACSAYAGVIETGQFVLQQTVLCSQMLAAVAPKPKQSFVPRYGSCHAKLLHARCFLLHEVWCAHASFNDVEKTQRYFTEYINSLSWIQKRMREKALFEAYMERGSQLLKRKQYAEALEQFTAAVEVAKKCVNENDAALAAKAQAKSAAAAASTAATTEADLVKSPNALTISATSPGVGSSTAGLVPLLSLASVGSGDPYVFIPRATTATAGCADDMSTPQPHDTAQEAEDAADLERTLDLQWHLAESERMMSLSLVAMAENEVNVPARRDELSHAVNSAYASQSSLQKWQAKGGSPKRILTGGPSNLIVMCRALLLLSQPRKAAVLLEPLVEDKGTNTSVRPPRWKEILTPTGQPLTAEDIALCVYVNSVRIAVYGLYVQCLCRFDGERALRAAHHVVALLEESERWVQTMRLLIREKQVEVYQTRISRSASVAYASAGFGGGGGGAAHSSETSPLTRTGPATLPGVQSHDMRTYSDGGLSSQASLVAESTSLATGPSEVISARPSGDAGADDANSKPREPAGTSLTQSPPGQGQVASYPPGGGDVSDKTPTSAAAVSPPTSPSWPSQSAFSILMESRSERVTALRALSQASLDITTGYRELSVTYGDAYCLLEQWEDALTAYSQAMVLCQTEEDLALCSSAGLTATLATGGAVSSRTNSNVVSPTTHTQFNTADGVEELLMLDNEADGGIMDIETMDPKMARNLRDMLVHGTRVDYKANANAINARLAHVHTALGKLSTAMDYHELVLDFAVETDDKLLQYKSLLALARLYTRTHATAKAHDTWAHVSALAHAYQDTTVGRETLRNIIAANEASGMFYDVITNAEQLNKLSSGVEGSEAMADRRAALEALAHAHLELAQYDKCHAALDEREKVQEKAVEWNGHLMSLRAQAFIGQGDIAEAIKVLVRYVNKARMLSNWSELGKANAGLAKAYASGENLFKARRSYMAALRAFALQGVLKDDEREVVLQAARWLVHYFYLSDEEVQIDASAVYEPEPSRRAAAEPAASEEVDETLEGRTTFEHNLHNNSGDLSQMLEEDESRRRTMTDEDFEDDFGGGWGDSDGGDDFLSGQSFAGANLASLLNGSSKTPSSSDVTLPSDGMNPLKTGIHVDEVGVEEPASGGSESGASAEVRSQDSPGAPPLPMTSEATSTTTVASAAPTAAKTTTTTTTTASGAPRTAPLPAPTSLAHVSFCSRPAAAASGKDALDGSRSGRDGLDEGEEKPTGAKVSSASSATPSTAANGAESHASPEEKRGASSATAAVSGGVSSAPVATDSVVTAAQRERRTRPSRVVTVHYRAALETMEWTTRLLTNGDRTLSYRPCILYSPAEAVDLAMLTHPRSTFVFYFAEYAMDSSSCYDVIVRPAHTSTFFRRSAQVTTLKAYQSPTVLDDIRTTRSIQMRAKMATAAFATEDAKSAADPDVPAGGSAANAPSLSPAEEAAELARLVDVDTRKRLYDLHDELWSGVKAGFRRLEQPFEAAESVIVVPDTTLLQVPFPALMANPDMSMPGESTAPIGEQATLIVVPSLLHLVQHDVTRGEVYTRRLTVPPLLQSAKDRKPVFLPESLQPRHSQVSNNSLGSASQIESGYAASTSGGGGAQSRTTATARRASASSSARAAPSASNVSSTTAECLPLPGVSVGTAMSARSATAANTAGSARDINSHSALPSGHDDESTPLKARWSVNYGCTRKALIHAFTDTTTRAIMVLCDVKGHTLVAGDGAVDFKELSQPITASLDATAAALSASRAMASTHPQRRGVTSASTSFVNSPQETTLPGLARLPRANSGISGASTTSTTSAGLTGAGVGAGNAHVLISSPGMGPSVPPNIGLSALGMSTSLSNMGVASLSNTVSATAGAAVSGAQSRPMMPEDVCTNLELVVLTCDRSAATNADEPGLAWRLCLQLGCARVLRVDLIRGQSFSNAHREFVNSYLAFLEKAQRWNLEGAYAVALRSSIAAARAAGVSSSVWGSFTLVGAP